MYDNGVYTCIDKNERENYETKADYALGDACRFVNPRQRQEELSGFLMGLTIAHTPNGRPVQFFNREFYYFSPFCSQRNASSIVAAFSKRNTI